MVERIPVVTGARLYQSKRNCKLDIIRKEGESNENNLDGVGNHARFWHVDRLRSRNTDYDVG